MMPRTRAYLSDRRGHPSSRNRSRNGKESRRAESGSVIDVVEVRAHGCCRSQLPEFCARAFHARRSTGRRRTTRRIRRVRRVRSVDALSPFDRGDCPAEIVSSVCVIGRQGHGYGTNGLALDEGSNVGGGRGGSCRKGGAERVLPNPVLVPTSAHDVLSHDRYLHA